MAISVTNLGTTFNASATTTIPLTLSTSVPAGSLIIFFGAERSTTNTSTVTDSSSNTYSSALAVSMNNTALQGYSKIFYAQNAIALSSGNTITWTLASSNKGTCGAVYATGAATTSALDATSSAFGSSTTPTGTSHATGAANYLVFAMGGTASGINTLTADTTNGWTNTPGAINSGTGSGANSCGEYWINPGTGTKTFTLTNSSSTNWAIIFASFKVSAATNNGNLLKLFW